MIISGTLSVINFGYKFGKYDGFNILVSSSQVPRADLTVKNPNNIHIGALRKVTEV